MDYESLLRLARQAIRHVINTEGVPGILGKADGSIRYTDPGGGHYHDRMWARINDQDSVTEIVVHAPSVPPLLNLPVIIAERDGIPTVIRVDYARAALLTGGRVSNVAEHAWMHGRFGPDALYITGPQFLPLMAHTADPPDMTVVVECAFYRYYDVEKVWSTAASGDLSGYVPEATPSGAVQHFLILCLNRATNVLAIVDGIDRPSGSPDVPFDEDDAIALTIPDTYWPICAIRFYEGMTEIVANDIFMDLRLWGGEYHAPVTFSGDVEDIFDIYNQVITLDEQDANTVLAGPIEAPAAEPTFRALVSADLPDPLAFKDAGSFLEIIGGSIAVSQTYHEVDAEGAPTNLQDIDNTNAVLRQLLVLRNVGEEIITIIHEMNDGDPGDVHFNSKRDFELLPNEAIVLFLLPDGLWTDIAPISDSREAIIGFTIHGGGEVITTGVKGYVPIPRNGVITKWELVANQSGSIVVDIWKDSYANFPPTIGDSITAAAPPTLSVAQKDTDDVLVDWITDFEEGDWLAFNVSSADLVKIVVLALYVTFEA